MESAEADGSSESSLLHADNAAGQETNQVSGGDATKGQGRQGHHGKDNHMGEIFLF